MSFSLHKYLYISALLLCVSCSISEEELLSLLEKGDALKLESFLERNGGIDINQPIDGHLPFQIAIVSDNCKEATLAALVAFGADINKHIDLHTIDLALSFSSDECIDYLLSKDVLLDVDGEGLSNPIYWAVSRGDAQYVAHIAKRVPHKVHAEIIDGETSHDIALKLGNQEVLELPIWNQSGQE